jgi:hypothetical protein
MADASAFRTDFFPAAQPNALLGTANEAMNFANAGQTNRLLGTENQTKQLELFQKQMGGLYDLYGSLLAKGPNLNAGDLEAAGQYAVKAGLASPEQVSNLMGSLPPNATPDQLQQFVLDQAARSLDAHERVSAFYGSPASYDVGGKLINGRQNAWGFITGNTTNKTLTPGEKVTPVPAGVTEGGQKVNAPQIKVLGAQGVDDSGNVIPGAAGEVAGAPKMVPNPSAGIVTELPTGTPEAQKASADLYAADRNAATRYETNAVPLMGAYKALVALGPQGTGQGKEVEAKFKNFLNAWGVPGVDVDKLANFEELSKYFKQNALAGNPGTDNQMAAMFTANPNTDQSYQAARALTASGIANYRYQGAMSREFAKTGQPEYAYADWAANNFNVNNDRRAYGFDLLTKAEQDKFVEGLSEPEFNKFAASLQKAQQLGLVSNGWTGD